MEYVIKRDNCKSKFNENKIYDALLKAVEANNFDLNKNQIDEILNKVINKINQINLDSIAVEQIQDIVVETLRETGNVKLADLYQNYRNERTKIRESKSELMKKIISIGIETDRDNANVGNNFSAKLLRIASEANKWHILNKVLPRKLAKLHENGDIYIHDLDSYNLTINCLHLPTGKLLKNGFNTGYGYINRPNDICVAAHLSCIMLQASQNDMFGGQSHPNFDNDLSIYVNLTRKKYKEQISEFCNDNDKINEIVEKMTIKSVHQAMQGVVFNLNTMHSRAGSQVPFSSINIGLPTNKDAALICEAFLEEYEKGLGQGEQPIFPNIIFRIKSGVNREPNDPYYYLFKLACRVAAKRMNPTFMNIDADFNKAFYDKNLLPATMGCRTYIMSNINGPEGCEGRGNNAPTTINLPRIGILANKNIDTFFKLLNDRISDASEILMNRYELLKKLKVKDLPFVAKQKLMMGSENLKPDDSIDAIMKNGTWGIGFIGIAECLTALLGKHHGQSQEAQELGIKIVSLIRQKCDELKTKTKLNWSCYATPAEGLSGKFIQIDKRMFGIIPGITDKDYYTNSFHIPVSFPISIADKIKLEAPYHKLCNAGHISYVEFDSYPEADTIEKIITWAYKNTNINYLGINFHIRYCIDCANRANKMRNSQVEKIEKI